MRNKNMWLSLIIVLVISSMVLGACQSAATPEATVVEETAGEPAATEQVLRILHPAFDQNWSPMLGGGHVSRLYSLWWAPPMYFDAAGEIHPMVFSEWTSNEDFTKWTFKIDPKAVFSDGSPITAEDVIGTFNLSAAVWDR